jgi:hypothetical protein
LLLLLLLLLLCVDAQGLHRWLHGPGAARTCWVLLGAAAVGVGARRLHRWLHGPGTARTCWVLLLWVLARGGCTGGFMGLVPPAPDGCWVLLLWVLARGGCTGLGGLRLLLL